MTVQTAEQIQLIDLGQLEVHPANPRKTVGDIDDIATSIGKVGQLSPLIAVKHDGKFRVVDGSRRLAALRKAGKQQARVTVLDASEAEAASIAIISNLQRKDLEPLEEAAAFRKWLDYNPGKTQKDLGEQVGLAPSTIANALRLLEAPKPVKEALASGEITAAHARVALELRDGSLAPSLKLRAGVTVDELHDQVRRANEEYDTKGEGARAALRNALAAAKAKYPNATITWKAGDYDVVSTIAALGQPPAKIVAPLNKFGFVDVARHDKSCTCRAYGLDVRRSWSGAAKIVVELERVCIDAKGYAAARPKPRKEPKPAKASAPRKPKPLTPEQLKKIEARERKERDADAARALTAPVLKPALKPLLKKLAKGSMPADVARAIVWMERIKPEFGMGLPDDAAKVAWSRLVALPAKKASALAAAALANWIGADWTSPFMRFSAEDANFDVATYFGVTIKTKKKATPAAGGRPGRKPVASRAKKKAKR